MLSKNWHFVNAKSTITFTCGFRIKEGISTSMKHLPALVCPGSICLRYAQPSERSPLCNVPLASSSWQPSLGSVLCVPQQSPAGSSWQKYASAWVPAPGAEIRRGAVLPRGAVTEMGPWSWPLVQDKSKTLSPAYPYPKYFPPFSSFDPSLNMCVWEKRKREELMDSLAG